MLAAVLGVSACAASGAEPAKAPAEGVLSEASEIVVQPQFPFLLPARVVTDEGVEEPADPAQGVQPTWAETQVFKIIGPDGDSLTAMVDLAEAVFEVGKAGFGVPADLGPQPILVRLVRPKQMPSVDRWHVAGTGYLGGTVVYLSWSKETALDDALRALSEGLLARAGACRDEAAKRAQNRPLPPRWLVLALARSVDVYLRPALRDDLAERARRPGALPSLTTILSSAPAAGLTAEYDAAAYWAAMFLSEEARHPDEFLALTERLWRQPEDAAQVLQGAFGAAIKEADGSQELWWRAGVQWLLRGRITTTRTMAESRRDVRRLAFVVLSKDGQDSWVELPDAFALREDEAIEPVLRAGLAAAKADLRGVNPVYHNALLSLGLAYEALLNESHKAFSARYARFMDDFEAAQRLDAAVTSAVGQRAAPR